MNAADLTRGQTYTIQALTEYPRSATTIVNAVHLIQPGTEAPLNPGTIRDALNTLRAGGYAVRTGKTGGGEQYTWSITVRGVTLRGEL